MSFYHVKLLELLSIVHQNDKSFLHVRLTLDQEQTLFWEIDEGTANNLRALITNKEEYHKYRLSFQSVSSSDKQFTSLLTKTYRDQSENIYFPSSEYYVEGLNSIKMLRLSSEIQSLANFLSFTLPIENEEVGEVKAPVEIEEVKKSKKNHKPAWVAAVLVSVLSILFLGYSGQKNEMAFARSDFNSEFQPPTLKKVEPAVFGLSNEQEIDSLVGTNAPHLHIKEKVSYRIPDGMVALTFDDGPSKYSQAIVDVLNTYQVGGTFFFIGLNVYKYPEHVQYVHDNGFSIGSHSIHHLDMTNLSSEEQEYEVIETNRRIEEITNNPVSLFRPPYGVKNEEMIKLMDQKDMKMVLWNKDTEDWKNRHSTEILDYVTSSKTSGSIILLHESQAVVDALPQIIEYLQSKGLQIVSLK